MAQDGTGKYHLSNSQVPIQACCAEHMHILSIKPLPRQHQLVPKSSQAELDEAAQMPQARLRQEMSPDRWQQHYVIHSPAAQ